MEINLWTKKHTCCVTGHRDIPSSKVGEIQAKLRQEVLNAIREGYTHFISGFATGTDLLFAEIIAEMKGEYPNTLEAAIPYPGRLNTPDTTFHRLIKGCDMVKVHTAQYSKSCYMVRNRYMVDSSALVIAVHDGRKTGGTAATIRYAHKRECVVWEIYL